MQPGSPSLLLLLLTFLLLPEKAPTISDAPPSDRELAKAAADLADGKAAALSRALVLLKRLELQGGGDGGPLLSQVFESLISDPTVSTTKTLGKPGDSVEFRLADQPDGSVFLCFNSSSSSGAHTSDVRLLQGGGRAQIRVVPYSSAVTGKPLQQLELSIGQLDCPDGDRRFACCSLQPGGDYAAIVCGQFRVSVAFC